MQLVWRISYRNKAKNESEGITFSQLARRTERYFNAAARGASAAADDLAVRNMTLKGQFWDRGRRVKALRQRTQSVDVSDFLAHDRPSPSKARRSKRRRGESKEGKRENQAEQQGGGGDEEEEEKEKAYGAENSREVRDAAKKQLSERSTCKNVCRLRTLGTGSRAG